jgi:hypothetical protein
MERGDNLHRTMVNAKQTKVDDELAAVEGPVAER